MKIQFYGCSYSDGGGMDTKEFYDFFKHEEWIKQYPNKINFNPLDIQLKNYFRFSNLIQRELKCNIQNNSVTANNNQNIFDVLMENLKNNNGDVHIVQWSHYYRMKIWDEKSSKFYRLGGLEKNTGALRENSDFWYDDKNMFDFFNKYIKHYFNEDYEKQRIINQVELLTSYSNQESIPIYFITWDELPYKNEKFIDITDAQKHTISYETNNKIEDYHLSYEGNKIVAKQIIKKLKENNLV